jgi:hypothetical protein
MTHQISSQEDFDAVKPQFDNSSQYEKFKERFHFDPASYIEMTGMPMSQALPRAKRGGDRWRIFEAVRSGLKVKTFNEKAKRLSPYAVWDADLFIMLYRGFVRLAPRSPGDSCG